MKLYAVTDKYIYYYIPMSSPKNSDYKDNKIRKSIVPIVRIISNEEIDNIPVLKGTLIFCLEEMYENRKQA